MLAMKKAIFHPAVEVLEDRIAPATLTFVDMDGDTVTIKTSKGTNADLAAAAHFSPVAWSSAKVLSQLALSSNHVFQGTSLSILVTSNPAGHVDIGQIDATGLDLGKVTIAGDVAQIIAGDSNFGTKGIASLEVNSLGAQGTTNLSTFGTSIISQIAGGVGSITVHGDVDGGFIVTGGTNGAGANIGAIKISGSVIGGSNTMTGYISAANSIKSLYVAHNVSGGTATQTGAIVAAGSIGPVTVGGDLVGGTTTAATKSGLISSNRGMGIVNILGNISGGLADFSGQLLSTSITSVHIGGMINGGGGQESGTIASSGFIASVNVEQGITGGSGNLSGSIRTTGGLGTVILGSDLNGGNGDQSGIVASDGPITSLTINGSIFGSSGFQSGAVGSSKSLGQVKVTGSVLGSIGTNSGEIVSQGTIGSVTLGGGLVGSSGFESGTIGAIGNISSVKIGPASTLKPTINTPVVTGGIAGSFGYQSGTILGGGDISNVVVNGSVNGSYGFESGSIVAAGNLVSITVHGDVSGGFGTQSGNIRAGQNINSVTIDGNLNGSGLNQGPAIVGFIPQGNVGGGFLSGAIVSSGKIGKVTIGGSIDGGVGQYSGIIETIGATSSASDIGTISVGFDVRGGSGFNSGNILSNGHIGNITIGTAASSSIGTFHTLAAVNDGSLIGSSGFNSGYISSQLGINSIVIKGSILGGSGPESGKIASGGDIHSIQIDGSLQGGSGGYNTTAKSGTPQIGQIYAAGTLSSITIGQEVDGGDSSDSGEIRAGSIGSVVVGGKGFSSDGGSLFGGGGFDSAAIVAEKGDIGFVHVSGALSGGSGINSASILAAHNIGTVEVGGAFGTAANPVNITAGGTLLPKSDSQALAIKSVTVVGNMLFTNVLAGYDISGNAINADVQIGLVQTKGTDGSGQMTGVNIVAGAVAGPDGQFGTFDDALITASDSPSILSGIAKIIVAGGFANPADEQSYGFVGEHVTTVIVSGKTIAQQAGPHNDFLPADTANLSTFINELGPNRPE